MTKPIPRDYRGDICHIDGCNFPIVTCNKILTDGKVCGAKGHPEVYKSGEHHIVGVVRHTHFLPLQIQDMGRNDFHKQKKMKAPESIKRYTWKINQQRKFPDEVRANLGWEDV